VADTTDAETQIPAPPAEDGEAAGGGQPEVAFELTASRQFNNWLAEQAASLAFSTYRIGKVFLIGMRPDGRLSVFERSFERAMGLCVSGKSLYLSTLYQLWRFEDAMEPGQLAAGGYDRLYVPQVAYVTGDLDIHDVAIDADGQVVFVNTLFSCLATTGDSHSFVPLWWPPFITKLAAEDRCHLNGLAMADGRPKYVTAVSRSDVNEGWRDRRRDGGIVIDVDSGEIVCTGLSMPHSPRVHDGRLWLLDSGTGFFGFVDTETGTFERVAFCPGYLRGLAFLGDFAIVGLSKCRENRTFSGLELDDNLAARDAEPRCGLSVIDLRSSDVVHNLRLEGVVDELYDVSVILGVRRPMAIGVKSDEVRRVLTIGEGET